METYVKDYVICANELKKPRDEEGKKFRDRKKEVQALIINAMLEKGATSYTLPGDQPNQPPTYLVLKTTTTKAPISQEFVARAFYNFIIDSGNDLTNPAAAATKFQECFFAYQKSLAVTKHCLRLEKNKPIESLFTP